MNRKHICKAPYQPQAGNSDLKVVLLVFVCSFIFLSEIQYLDFLAQLKLQNTNKILSSLGINSVSMQNWDRLHQSRK